MTDALLLALASVNIPLCLLALRVAWKDRVLLGIGNGASPGAMMMSASHVTYGVMRLAYASVLLTLAALQVSGPHTPGWQMASTAALSGLVTLHLSAQLYYRHRFFGLPRAR